MKIEYALERFTEATGVNLEFYATVKGDTIRLKAVDLYVVAMDIEDQRMLDK